MFIHPFKLPAIDFVVIGLWHFWLLFHRTINTKVFLFPKVYEIERISCLWKGENGRFDKSIPTLLRSKLLFVQSIVPHYTAWPYYVLFTSEKQKSHYNIFHPISRWNVNLIFAFFVFFRNGFQNASFTLQIYHFFFFFLNRSNSENIICKQYLSDFLSQF